MQLAMAVTLVDPVATIHFCSARESLLKCLLHSNRSFHGPKMRDLRERPALRKCDQPRQQYAAPALESEFAPRPRACERRAQAVTRVHQLPAIGPRQEGRLIRRIDSASKVVTW